MLTLNQLNRLRHDLLDLAHIEYDEVMAELLDHYASLTEQFMAEGLPFEEASTKAWIQLGNGPGILHIQKRYKKLLLDQMQMQHRAIVRRYFRWPTLITTLLIGLLAYSTAKLLSPGAMGLFFLIVVFSPHLLFIPSELRLFWCKRIKKQIVLASLRREVILRQARYGNYLYLAIVQLPVMVTSFFLDDKHWSANRPYLFEWHAGLSAALAFVAIVYTLTFFEFYAKHSTQRSASA